MVTDRACSRSLTGSCRAFVPRLSGKMIGWHHDRGDIREFRVSAVGCGWMTVGLLASAQIFNPLRHGTAPSYCASTLGRVPLAKTLK